ALLKIDSSSWAPLRAGAIFLEINVSEKPGRSVISAKVQIISLGFTVLVDEEKHEVVVPNNIMMGSTIIRVAREPVQ
ncbi:hypothetical protein, partial [Variovorax boronicumulans]|uniref:hypothetical protein n=1 Tax=Variovorax boronicumulans TaxID=436515 RepID=UPI0027D902DD